MATESVEMLESGEETSSSIGSDASPNPGIVANPHENLDFSYDSVHEDDEEGAGSKSEDGEVTDDEEEAPKSEDDGEVLEDGEVNVPIVQKPDDSQEDSVEEGEVTDEEVISELDRKDNKPVPPPRGDGQGFVHNVRDGSASTPSGPALERVVPPNPNARSPIIESAWERGLRHAKEIIKASAKRKETDVDFEEKKINLSLAGDEEIDKENNDYYVRKPELHVGKVDVLDPDYGVHSPIPQTLSARQDRPRVRRERVHRIKGARPKTEWSAPHPQEEWSVNQS
ncbi:Zinc finger CCCH domain-containing protein 18 [Orchesella cincta]|uniref:Zinc finger CCCH domain-containing protein 18 n=1 Tax=Orchesella cincta TaxID=48709 RepID=A0A1D2MJG6_ORCCI|nr:Zinc finger CCCH domain-containing protein 18 [Orchesella cincta]